jgi:hypothetical protein
LEDSLDYSLVDLGFGPNGLPVLVSSVGSKVVVVTCDDMHCATGTQATEIDPNPPGVIDPGIADVYTAFGDDGSFTVWLMRDGENPDLLICSDPTCADPGRIPFSTTRDPILNRLGHVVDEQGRTFAFYETWSRRASLPNIRLTECSQAGCLHHTAPDHLLYQPPTEHLGYGWEGGIVLAGNGAPLAAMGIDTEGGWRIMVAFCDDPQCNTSGISWVTPASPTVINFLRLAIGPEGNPVLAYTSRGENGVDLFLTVCSDPRCTTYTSQSVASRVRWNWDLAVDAEQTPYLVWGDVATDEAMIAKCAQPDCSSLTTIHTGLFGTADWFAGLAIAPDGCPMVTFYDPAIGFRIFNCLPEVCNPLDG